MVTKIILAVLSVLLFAVCKEKDNPVSQPEAKPEQIPFTIHTGHYFIISTYQAEDSVDFLIVKSYRAFDSLFNWAGGMNQDTSPVLHETDFEDSMVVAIVAQGKIISKITTQSVSLLDGRMAYVFTKTDTSSLNNLNNIAIALLKKCDYAAIDFYRDSVKISNPSTKTYN